MNHFEKDRLVIIRAMVGAARTRAEYLGDDIRDHLGGAVLSNPQEFIESAREIQSQLEVALEMLEKFPELKRDI